MKRPQLPPFRIRKQRIERIVLTGLMIDIDAAFDYLAKTNYLMTKVGPQEVKGKTDETRFILFGEKVIR